LRSSCHCGLIRKCLISACGIVGAHREHDYRELTDGEATGSTSSGGRPIRGSRCLRSQHFDAVPIDIAGFARLVTVAQKL
jgi:hypothetical protein